MEPLPVTALKNWLYCPRQVYFTLATGLPPRVTAKMEEGKRAHIWRRSLEIRRTLARYGLKDRRRRFDVVLRSERLALSGVVDLLLEGSEGLAVVEFKLTVGEPGPADWFQLAAYGMLVEDSGSPVDRLIWSRIPDGAVYQHAFTDSWRIRTAKLLEQIRNCVERQVDPGPVDTREKCADCEFQNFCGDIW